jgi:hypothetical protein
MAGKARPGVSRPVVAWQGQAWHGQARGRGSGNRASFIFGTWPVKNSSSAKWPITTVMIKNPLSAST